MSSPKPNQLVSDNPGIRRARRLNTLLTIILPLAGTIAAIVMLPWLHIGALEIAMLIAMWLISGTGITVGFHRHFAHRAFKTSTAVRISLLIMGCMAGQGPLIYWVALHRRHHQYSDSPSDPYSPHTHGDRGLKAWRGF